MGSLEVSGDALWTRMERAVEKVDQRLRRAVALLEEAEIPYAVVGGNAVKIWVAQVDESAVRNTQDVDILIRPDDLPRIIETMEVGGFFYRKTANVDMFVETVNGSARDAVHMVLSGQMVRNDDFEANPDVESCADGGEFRTLRLESLVRMKLNSYRLKDRVHLLDMIEVGLVDEKWPSRFPEVLGTRLQSLIDDPNQ